MKEYVYPALSHANADGSYTITYPDLPGCVSEGKTITNAIDMAQSALSQWIAYMEDKGLILPPASAISDISVKQDEFVRLIRSLNQKMRG